MIWGTMKKELKSSDEIFNLLENGEGWAYVTNKNVNELITIALERNNKKLERELRNWR